MSKELIRLKDVVMSFDGETILDNKVSTLTIRNF